MRTSLFSSVAIAAVCAGVTPSAANLVISNGVTQNMTCSAGTCAPTAIDAVLNVGDLAAILTSGNATVTTTGSGVQANNIVLDARLQWSATNALTLDAFKSVRLNRPMSVNGAGIVSINTGVDGSGGGFWCGDKGRLQFKNLSGALMVNGTAYTLVSSVSGLATAIAAHPSGAFALAKDYNASADGTYSSPPIPTFPGIFNGLGNAISNLSINDPAENAYVGLFAETAGARIANVRLLDENVQGGSGSSESSSTEYIGGLVGYASGGLITNGFTTGSVTGGDFVAVGGLLGVGDGSVTGSGSAANVSSTPASSGVGGLIGIANGAIKDSFATGNVTGGGFVGGLVGFYAGSSVKHAWASGTVSSSDSATWVGGLAGMNQKGTIEESHASGDVTCAFGCGGLVAFEGGGGMPKISQSYATGNVTANISGSTGAGGLVAFNDAGSIANSYASGAVTAADAGGLVALNEPSGVRSISDSYATGVVSGASNGSVGGLVSDDDNHGTSTIRHTYWDMTTSGISNPGQGAGNVANDPGIKGLRNKQLKSALPKGFDNSIWAQDKKLNGGRPYLIANPPTN